MKELLRAYWMEAAALALGLACLANVAVRGAWSSDYPRLLVAAFGLLSVLFSEEVALTTGRYGWTRAQWWQDPEEWVKWTGALTLLVVTIQLFAS